MYKPQNVRPPFATALPLRVPCLFAFSLPKTTSPLPLRHPSKYIRHALQTSQPPSFAKPERTAEMKRIDSIAENVDYCRRWQSPRERAETREPPAASLSLYLSLSNVRTSLMQKPLGNLSPQPSHVMQANNPPFVPI
jgi:hypothetical protein